MPYQVNCNNGKVGCLSNLFFKKEADPIRKRLQQKNLSVWKGFRLKIKSSKKLSLGEYGRQRTSKKFHDLVQSIRKQTESEDIVLELDEKDSEEATEEETKEV